MTDLHRRRVLGRVMLAAPASLAARVAPSALAALAAWTAADDARANTAAAASTNTPADVPPELQTHWPGTTPPRLQGQGRLRFLGLSIYDIRLWSPADQRVSPEAWPGLPLALEIIYRRALVGQLIAERSIREMQRAEPLDATASERWLRDMTDWFPDVVDGDRITGLHAPGADAPARFFHNGKARGKTDDAAFARRFFGIWLDAKTSEPALREQLLGLR